jgi:hypothetical protein
MGAWLKLVLSRDILDMRVCLIAENVEMGQVGLLLC